MIRFVSVIHPVGLRIRSVRQVTGKKVAIKKIKDVFRDLTDAKRILREIKLLRLLGGHQNIIWILDIMVSPNARDFRDMYIVTDLLDTDLGHIISSRQELSDAHIKYFLYQILRGLKFVHSAKVLHRDLKPQNILVNANCELVICDFGLARALGRYASGEPADSDELLHAADLTTYVVTRWYRAPELLVGSDHYDAALDVWSVGCILGELLGRQPLLPGRNYQHQLQIIVDMLGTPSEADMHFIRKPGARHVVKNMGSRRGKDFRRMFPRANPDAVDLLSKMLMFDPSKRISVEQALEHPFLADYHYPDDEPVAPREVEFDFDRMGTLTRQYLQTKMIEEMVRHPGTEGPLSMRASKAVPSASHQPQEHVEESGALAGAGVGAGAAARLRRDDVLSPSAAAEEAAELKRHQVEAATRKEKQRNALAALGGPRGGGDRVVREEKPASPGGKEEDVAPAAKGTVDRFARLEAVLLARMDQWETRLQAVVRDEVTRGVQPLAERLTLLESRLTSR